MLSLLSFAKSVGVTSTLSPSCILPASSLNATSYMVISFELYRRRHYIDLFCSSVLSFLKIQHQCFKQFAFTRGSDVGNGSGALLIPLFVEGFKWIFSKVNLNGLFWSMCGSECASVNENKSFNSLNVFFSQMLHQCLSNKCPTSLGSSQC